jgi:hypothetical protein
MKENFMNQYESALQSKKEALLTYLKNQVERVTLPTPPQLPVEATVEAKAIPPFSFLFGGLGLTAVIGGICTGKGAIVTGGSILLLMSVGLYLRSKPGKQAPAVRDIIDYPALSNKLYKTIEGIHSFISEDWDNFLGKQKDALKNDIQALDVETDKKNKLLETAIKRSVIICSMLDELSALNAIERSQDITAYRDYLPLFEKKYGSIIEKAYREQKETYESISLATKQ